MNYIVSVIYVNTIGYLIQYKEQNVTCKNIYPFTLILLKKKPCNKFHIKTLSYTYAHVIHVSHVYTHILILLLVIKNYFTPMFSVSYFAAVHVFFYIFYSQSLILSFRYCLSPGLQFLCTQCFGLSYFIKYSVKQRSSTSPLFFS